MQMQKYTWSEQVYICTGCIFAHVQINFYIYAIAFTCPKIHPGANYTYMYNLHTVCKSAHVNGALVSRSLLSYLTTPVTAVTPTDRPKSFLVVFFFYVVTMVFCGCRGFVIGLSQISSFIFYIKIFMVISTQAPKRYLRISRWFHLIPR